MSRKTGEESTAALSGRRPCLRRRRRPEQVRQAPGGVVGEGAGGVEAEPERFRAGAHVSQGVCFGEGLVEPGLHLLDHALDAAVELDACPAEAGRVEAIPQDGLEIVVVGLLAAVLQEEGEPDGRIREVAEHGAGVDLSAEPAETPQPSVGGRATKRVIFSCGIALVQAAGDAACDLARAQARGHDEPDLVRDRPVLDAIARKENWRSSSPGLMARGSPSGSGAFSSSSRFSELLLPVAPDRDLGAPGLLADGLLSGGGAQGALEHLAA